METSEPAMGKCPPPIPWKDLYAHGEMVVFDGMLDGNNKLLIYCHFINFNTILQCSPSL